VTIKNLWGEINNLPKVKAPVAILNEQAQQLEELTGGLLTCRVAQLNTNNPSRFSYQFSINAPSLNNYSFTAFFIDHDMGLYPLKISYKENENKPEITCNDINEFESALGEIFSSPEIRRVISGLLSQIQTV
jgi:hypothetical protein